MDIEKLNPTTETTIVTESQIKDFIRSQPDSREVNMGQNFSRNECGCVMVHYGKEVLGIQKKFGCGSSTWESDEREDYNKILAGIDKVSIFTILDGIPMYKNLTYKDLKKAINET